MSSAMDGVLLRMERCLTVPHEVETSDMASGEDSVLVERARKGDYGAFEDLVRKYRNNVFALAFHFVRNREDAWDVSQEVFVKAHHGLKSFRGEASFKTWLLRITVNQCKDFMKKRRLPTVAYDDALGATETPSPGQTADRMLELKELGKAIGEALELLPLKHKTAFVLREFEGMTYQEMARVMGCNLGTVMSRLYHARRKLQDNLLRMGIVEG
jgi:RNA polymerase sigma-70 factor, ECF subfamily